jgi:PLP dependent protein
VDSESLLKEINKQATKNNRVIDVLLQVHIAQEETKFGFSEEELENVLIYKSRSIGTSYENVQIKGLMGMASFSDDMTLVRREFAFLKNLFDKTHSAFAIQHSPLTIDHSPFTILSMGMSGDYKTAVEEGSTMVRIGSLIFGEREKK